MDAGENGGRALVVGDGSSAGCADEVIESLRREIDEFLRVPAHGDARHVCHERIRESTSR